MKIKGSQPQDANIEWLGFKGLDIQPDVLSRPFDSWQRLENCDLFVPGSIRKIVGPKLLGGPYESKTPPPLPPLEVVSEEIVYGYTSTGSDTEFGDPVVPLDLTVLLPTDIQPGDQIIAIVCVQGYFPGVGAQINPLDAIPDWDLIDDTIASAGGFFTILKHTVNGTEGPTVTFQYSGPAYNFSGLSLEATLIPVRYADPVNPVTVYTSDRGVQGGPGFGFDGPITTVANTIIFALFEAFGDRKTVGSIDGTSTIFNNKSDPSLIANTALLGQAAFVGPGATGNFASDTGWTSVNASGLILAINPAPIIPPVPPVPTVIVEMAAYKQTPTTPFIDIGIGADGSLYDLILGTFLASLGGLPGQPFVCTFPGTAFTGAAILYLLSTLEGAPPVKYDGLNVTPIGVSPPIGSVAVTPSFSATNASAYLMQVGIQYLWTYFNPDTLHESSPSPVTDTSIITPTTNQPPASQPYITQVKLSIPTPDPAIGVGYSKIRVYRTRDGGATFFLLPKLYNSAGLDLVDANGAVARANPTTTVYDGVASVPDRPQPDAVLVNPPGGAPAIGANDPPPVAVWGAVYQSRYWLVKADLKTLVFSNIGDFQSFGVDSYFQFSKDILDEITAIIALSDRMIVNGKNSARQITGSDFTNFTEVPVDMRRGALGRRAATNDGDKMYVLTSESLARMSFAAGGPPFIGDHIKPLTDSIKAGSLQSVVNMDINAKRGILYFAIQVNGVVYNDQIILADLSRDSPFSIVTGLPTEVITVRDLEFADGTTDLVFSGADGYTYRLYDNSGGNGSLVAVAETQQLPLVDLDIWRVFQDIATKGVDGPNWTAAFSVDGGNTFTTERPLFNKLPIGMDGKELIIRFTHNVNNGVAALISRAKLRYELKMGAQ